MTTTRTTCPYCGVGCGVLATVDAEGAVSIAGDPEHPANYGRLCSKGSALAETLGLEERLLHPKIAGQRASWDEALGLVASVFKSVVAGPGPDAVAIYGSGQLLTEDYYVANKLMKGFIGSANIDTNSRLCMASSVAGHKRAFGSDTVPGNYEDLELADLIVLVGSNLSWCHPVLYQRIVSERSRRPQMRIVVIDPRRTATAEEADLHLPLRADGDIALFVGLLRHLDDMGASAWDFLARSADGADAALLSAREWTIDRVADATGVDAGTIATFYEWFGQTERVVTVFSQGVNQSASGTDKVNAIINCHLLTGRIGRPGMGPFSVTGQPNAMGGREVGGLANMLAAHMDFTPDAVERLGRFWGSTRVATAPGLKAVEMFRAVARGEIRAIWIMATNPVDSMPEADLVRAALKACPFVVVSDISARTDTAAYADVRLPACGWGEKDGTVTNSERRISRQRPFRPAPGEAKPDWWIVSQVARRMGYGASFAYRGPGDVFAEHVALSAFENGGRRDFDLSGLMGAHYADLQPVQWPVRKGGDTARLFGDGRFFTRNGRAKLVTVTPPPPLRPGPHSFVLNTGRVRDHWHTMTRTGLSPRLSAHYSEPFVEIHPTDAAALSIRRASLVRLTSRCGTALVRALVTDRQRRGQVFVPIHWTDQFASNSRIDALVEGRVDPVSGQPALKMGAVQIEPALPRLYGFFIAANRPQRIDAGYWAIARADGGWRGELAWFADAQDWDQWVRATFAIGPDMKIEQATDATHGRRSFAVLAGGRVIAALYVSPDPVPVARQWAAGLLSADNLDAARTLAGRPGSHSADGGAVVCACNAVGVNVIASAIRAGCTTVDAVGNATGAGTNCGSCRSEIRALLAAEAAPLAKATDPSAIWTPGPR